MIGSISLINTKSDFDLKKPEKKSAESLVY